jgi:uncharacterized membrane protein
MSQNTRQDKKEEPQQVRQAPWIVRSNPLQRLGFAAGLGAVCFLALTLLHPAWLSEHAHLLISWDLGTLTYLVLSWTLITVSDATTTRAHVRAQDQNVFLIFLLVVAAALTSIIVIGFLVSDLKGIAFWPKAFYLTLSIMALIESWLLIQTVFAFHYARIYYSINRPKQIADAEHAELIFPGTSEPDYLDFAYYAFVVGMTSQVSDVAVTSRRMRRLTMIHGVLAFIFNIVIVALSINIIASVI